MPELPEVETVKRVLEPQISGQKITEVLVRHPQVIAFPSAEEFGSVLEGQRIAGMGRRGKFLSVFTEEYNVVLHLRMTGCLLVTLADHEMAKHTHLVLRLENGKEIRFIDPRRFGRFWLLNKSEEDRITGIHKLGPEPFDKRLDAGYLQTAFCKKKKSVKECLLEQDIIAGIGNIYSDEILFRAQINPLRRANSLMPEELARLAGEIPVTMSYYIEKNEITAEEYLAGKGWDYRNTPFLKVYGRSGSPCPVCKTMLCRCIIGGRSSVYCPQCQREEE